MSEPESDCGKNKVCCFDDEERSISTNLEMSSRAFGKKCRNDAGGVCKWSCTTSLLSPDDCFWGRKCCK